MLEIMKCPSCGGDLVLGVDHIYTCSHCLNKFRDTVAETYEASLKKFFDEEKLDRISAAKQSLWDAMHAKYINSDACIEYARALKVYLPKDYFANFAEIANQGSDGDVSEYLNQSKKEDMDVYADAVLDFMLKSLTAGNLDAVCNYIERAFTDDNEGYTKYIGILEDEAPKVKDGIYETSIPRDVFIVYSSKDISEVMKLCTHLEDEGISCFYALRNLRHGKGAADNYERDIYRAMDSCNTIVFVSSKNSRSLDCDGFNIELAYLRECDIKGANADCRNVPYEKIPTTYKKNRVEYLLDGYGSTSADRTVRMTFHGYTWVRSVEAVADRITEYKTKSPVATGVGKVSVETYVESNTPIEKKERNVIEEVAELKRKERRRNNVRSFNAKYFKTDRLGHIILLIILAVIGLILGFTVKNRAGGIFLIVSGAVTLIVFIFFGRGVFSGYKDGPVSRARNFAFIMASIVLSAGILFGGVVVYEGLERKDDDFTYRVTLGYAYVTEYNGDSTDVVIPSKYKNKTVAEIGRSAFRSSSVSSVTIPDSVKRIKKYAFSSSFSLKSVEMNCKIKKICKYAFWDCRSLTSIDLTGCREIKDSAFRSCGSLSEVKLTGSIRKIGEYAFDSCTSLTDIDLTGCKKIDDNAFDSCISLTYVTLSEGLKEIGKSAFSDCRSLYEITIPSTVKTIGKYAFLGCNMSYAYFADPSDWICGQMEASESELSDPVSAATLLNGSNKKWKH